jgi:hypothetical protein
MALKSSGGNWPVERASDRGIIFSRVVGEPNMTACGDFLPHGWKVTNGRNAPEGVTRTAGPRARQIFAPKQTAIRKRMFNGEFAKERTRLTSSIVIGSGLSERE